jgi:hypothetical protein
VTQKLADFRQRCARPQHLCRRSVAQTMSMDVPKVGASIGGSHNLRHPAGIEGAMRRFDPHEYRPSLGTLGTAVVQIRGNRSTNVCRQRRTLGTLSSTAHNDLAARQSISSSRSAATSPALMPRRTSIVRMAMSRRPFRVLLSPDARRR